MSLLTQTLTLTSLRLQKDIVQELRHQYLSVVGDPERLDRFLGRIVGIYESQNDSLVLKCPTGFSYSMQAHGRYGKIAETVPQGKSDKFLSIGRSINNDIVGAQDETTLSRAHCLLTMMRVQPKDAGAGAGAVEAESAAVANDGVAVAAVDVAAVADSDSGAGGDNSAYGSGSGRQSGINGRVQVLYSDLPVASTDVSKYCVGQHFSNLWISGTIVRIVPNAGSLNEQGRTDGELLVTDGEHVLMTDGERVLVTNSEHVLMTDGERVLVTNGERVLVPGQLIIRKATVQGGGGGGGGPAATVEGATEQIAAREEGHEREKEGVEQDGQKETQERQQLEEEQQEEQQEGGVEDGGGGGEEEEEEEEKTEKEKEWEKKQAEKKKKKAEELQSKDGSWLIVDLASMFGTTCISSRALGSELQHMKSEQSDRRLLLLPKDDSFVLLLGQVMVVMFSDV
jgi:hypothetical protein